MQRAEQDVQVNQRKAPAREGFRQEQPQEQWYEKLPEYKMFLNSVKSAETRKAYAVYFSKYVEYLGSEDLFCGNDPRAIERHIIDFIVSLKEKGMSFSGVKNYVTAIMSFYKINDQMLNSKKVGKFMPEQRRANKDKAYSHEQIHSLLDIADDRFRVIILLMASTGIRVGAIPELRIKHLQKVDKQNDIYKVTAYENSKDEYISFTTAEATKAIDRYLDFRKRYGEELNEDSPLIREQFNVKDPFVAKYPRQVNIQTLDRIIANLSERAGIRKMQKIKGTDKKAGSIRHEIAVCHGLRKFFTNGLRKAGISHEVRWLLEGHNLKGNDSSYVRITEDEMLAEYEKAVNNLTINEEHRLRMEVQSLKAKKDAQAEIQALQDQIKEMREATDDRITDEVQKLKALLQNGRFMAKKRLQNTELDRA